jgi:hypothetical protein
MLFVRPPCHLCSFDKISLVVGTGMSHNPYDRALYDLLDATGQMCWDENRDYGAK